MEHEVSRRVHVTAPAAETWRHVSRIAGWPDWLTAHVHWRDDSEHDDAVEGARPHQHLRVFGVDFPVHWKVETCDERRHRLELTGRARGDVDVQLVLTVAATTGGSDVTMLAGYEGGVMAGVVGESWRRHFQTVLDESLTGLADLIRPDAG